MNSFINNIEQCKIRIIGFDLDGTIYDEFDFIKQAYKSVSLVISSEYGIDEEDVFRDLCIEWLRYGSSANIFQNVISKYTDNVRIELIKECVKRYRDADIKLELSERARMTFEYLNENAYKLFIVTDGHSELQRKKIESLGLNKWFKKENIAISGDYGVDKQKPSSYMAGEIAVLKNNKKGVLYLGDRNVDREFANKCKFYFQTMKNMNIFLERYMNE